MHLTSEHKHELLREMVKAIISALEKHQIRVHELHDLADTILSEIETLHDHADLIVFLVRVNHKWPIFQHILEKEKNSADHKN